MTQKVRDKKFPKYVRMGDPKKGTTLRHVSGNQYYRDAGDWVIEAEWSDDVLISRGTPFNKANHKNLIGHHLTPITRAEYRKDNARYV